MAEFDYKQRPFSTKLTDAEYDRAVGRIFPHSSEYRTCARCGDSFSPITSGADNRYKFCSCACEDAG